MKKVLLTTISLIAVVSFDGSLRIASSADMAVKAMPVKAPPLAQDPWTGWYAGVNLGGADQRTCPKFSPEGIPDPVNDDFLAALITGCKSAVGVIGGAQVGFNKQVGNWVVGFETDFD